MKKLRIGLFGGAFDPLHNGHLMLANQAKIDLNLRGIIFIPCGESPYLNKKTKAPKWKRFQMLTHSVSAYPGFAFSDFEVARKKTSYTIDTVKFFVKNYPNVHFVLIVGPDGVDSFDSWKQSDKIKEIIEVRFAGKDFYCPDINIRSTLIRDMVKKGKSIKFLVPDAIERYIAEKGLYK